jgi:hypothetical protein
MGRMTPTRFRECLDALSWSQRGVADLLRVNERQVRRWATGQYLIPDKVAAWLDTLASFHAANPAPMAPPQRQVVSMTRLRHDDAQPD